MRRNKFQGTTGKSLEWLIRGSAKTDFPPTLRNRASVLLQNTSSSSPQQGPVRLQGWCNYDCRPFFTRPPTPLKSSVELQNSACRVDTYPPLKTVGFRGFWPRYARLKTTHPPKVSQRQPGSTPTHPHADSEICNHNYTAPANEQGPAAPAGSSSRQQARCLQRIVFTKTTSAPSEERSATDFVKFVHSVSFYPASTASYWNLPTNVQPASSQLPLLATASSRATTP